MIWVDPEGAQITMSFTGSAGGRGPRSRGLSGPRAALSTGSRTAGRAFAGTPRAAGHARDGLAGPRAALYDE